MMRSNSGVESSDHIGHGLKKGPWTAAEDSILMEYVKRHGEGNWNAVQKNSGLMRCGKSCRLRWANHLRPNLKKGSFSPEEETIIIDLHAKLGNKWARMAAQIHVFDFLHMQLPGRTDNEIKNYWNTRMKRRQRAGLPIYPQDQDHQAVGDAGFLFQQRTHKEQEQGRKRPNYYYYNNTSSSNYHLLSSSQPKRQCDFTNFSLLDSMNLSSAGAGAGQNQAVSSFYSNLNHRQYLKLHHHDSNTNTADTDHLYNKENIITTAAQAQTPLFINSGNTFSSLLMGMGTTQTVDFVPPGPGLKPAELIASSYQTPPAPLVQPTATASSSGTGNPNTNKFLYKEHTSGLLDSLLAESRSLSFRNQRNQTNCEDFPHAPTLEEEEEDGDKCVDLGNQWDEFSSSHSSIGVKVGDESIEETNSMDDDLLSLLNNFPSSMPLPEWYNKTNRPSNGSSSSAYMSTVRSSLDVL
ncbi:hypothetical protein CCACVL1_11585 [Corchorus capsularis]|uniref:Uncharacterized protein n=1 Tax=Corchorus capsularis TaxID=210143 RepID=A0A1R3IKK7_COCAP|nr:hypothetical protein CCACVL1_11585 [Corchorus capsularis]